MKKVKMAIALILLTMLLVQTSLIPAHASGFPDISSSHRYLDAINYVSDNHIMVGDETGYFNPNSALTRAMCVVVLYQKAGSPYAPPSQSFSDVPANAWYYDAVNWAVSEGITSGTGGGKFEPNTEVSRQNAMRFLYLYAQQNVQISGSKNITGYSDYSSISDYAKSAVSWAIGNGILEPATSTTIAPKATIKRAELAYAITTYGTNVEGLREGEDTLSFYNEGGAGDHSYFSQQYYMTTSHQNKFRKKLSNKYGNGTTSYNSAVEKMNRFLNTVASEVPGRCFGMSAVSALDKYGKIAFNENVGYGAANMSSVFCSPRSDVESMITYYHLSQTLSDIYVPMKKDISNTLSKMVSAPGLSLFCYSVDPESPYVEEYAHAVLVNSCTYTGGNYNLQLYDSNEAGMTTLTISQRNGHYFLPNQDNIEYADVITNFGVFNYLDIDGYQNSKSVASSSNSFLEPAEIMQDMGANMTENLSGKIDPEQFSTLYFYLQDGVTIANNRGETLTWENGKVTGNMEIYGWNFITGTSPVEAFCDVPVSETFRIKVPEGRKGELHIVDKYRFQYVENFTGEAVLSSDGTIQIDSAEPDSEIEAGFYSSATGDELCEISGKASQSVKLNLKQKSLKAEGLLGEYTVTVKDENDNEIVSVHTAEESSVKEPLNSSMGEVINKTASDGALSEEVR